MSRKTKINVLLPFKMVGELESRARNNTRSSFIEDAIRSKLDDEDAFDIDDFDNKKLAVTLVNRLSDNPSGYEKLIVMCILEWMNQ